MQRKISAKRVISLLHLVSLPITHITQTLHLSSTILFLSIPNDPFHLYRTHIPKKNRFHFYAYYIPNIRNAYRQKNPFYPTTNFIPSITHFTKNNPFLLSDRLIINCHSHPNNPLYINYNLLPSTQFLFQLRNISNTITEKTTQCILGHQIKFSMCSCKYKNMP